MSFSIGDRVYYSAARVPALMGRKEGIVRSISGQGRERLFLVDFDCGISKNLNVRSLKKCPAADVANVQEQRLVLEILLHVLQQ
jgi:hypothetical protein